MSIPNYCNRHIKRIMFAELARRTQQLGPDHTPQLADLQEDAEVFTVTCGDTEEASTRPFLDWVYWTFCMATEVPLIQNIYLKTGVTDDLSSIVVFTTVHRPWLCSVARA